VKIHALLLIIALEAFAYAQPSAEDLYSQGEEAFNRRDYATAITKWQTSYDLSHEPLLLFNLAHAYRLSGDCPRALAAYRKFIADDPTADEYALAQKLSQEMEGLCGAPPTPALPTPIATQPPSPKTSAIETTTREDRTDRPGRTLKITGLVVGGVGLATLATGLYLGHYAQGIGDEVTAACRTSCDWSAWKDRDAQGQRYSTIGRGVAIAGGIGIAGGVALYYLGLRQGSITVEPRAREGTIVSWGGTW